MGRGPHSGRHRFHLSHQACHSSQWTSASSHEDAGAEGQVRPCPVGPAWTGVGQFRVRMLSLLASVAL